MALRALAALALGWLLLDMATTGARPALAGPGTPSALSSPDDWSTYLHDPQRTAASNETILSPTSAGQLTRLWSFKTGGVVAASPTVVGGTVYVGSWDGYEYALDAASGALKWKTYLGVTSAPACNPPAAGISSAAAVQNGVVYVGGGDAYWYALDATTGAILWKVFTGDNSATGGHYNWSSPLIANGYAYIGVASLGDCPLVQGQLLQVSLSAQQVVNTFDVVPAGQVGGGIWTSPSLDPTTNTVFVTTGTETSATQPYTQALLAIDATTLTLKAAWKLPEAQAVGDSDWGTTPILFHDAAGNPLVEAINKNGVAYAFNRNNIAAGPVWQQPIAFGGSCPQCGDGSLSSGAFAKGTLFLAGGKTTINGVGYMGSVRALDPATGNFLWQHGAEGVVLAALADTNGLVIDGAGSVLEVLDASTGARLYTYQTGGTIYAAPSVSNGEIFAGSVDGRVYAFGLPVSPPPPPPPDPNCPSGWTCQDVGNPAPAGSETVSGGTWSVSAGGAGVGGTSDQFRLLTQTVSGDTQITARVAPSQAVSATSQAGAMIRQSTDPGSPYYAAIATSGGGWVVQYRTAFSGVTKVANQLSTTSLPLDLEIQRIGDRIQAATSSDGVTYTLIPGSVVILVMPARALVGLAVSSGSNGTAGTATASGVALGTPSPSLRCLGSWWCADIGITSPIGSQALSDGVWTVQGGGSDIWNTSDHFHFVWQTLAADGSLSAHVTSQANTSTWAKAGVMLRQSVDPGSPYYAAYVTPSNGIVVQYRAAPGASAAEMTSLAGTAPAYLQVARIGTTFAAYTSSDGLKWTPIAGSSITLTGLSGTLLVGLAVTAHNPAALSTATFDQVILNAAVAPPNTCPGGWSCADIGNPALAGGQLLGGGKWLVRGSGSDIWGKSDHFHFVWQTLAADGSLSAHVTSQANTSTWAKAGVMLRLSTDPGSPYYAVYVTPANGIAVQERASQSSSAAQIANIAGTVPAYLKIARSGTTYTAYTSSDGVTWTLIAGSTITVSGLSGTLLEGLAVTAHNANALSTATFDSVTQMVGAAAAKPTLVPTRTPASPASTATPSPIATPTPRATP